MGGAADLRAGRRGDRLRRERARAVRPRRRARARGDPVAAGGRRRAPPPRARGHAPAGRPGARVRRAARGAPLRDADRLRRVGDQPVPDARVAVGGRGRRARSSRPSATSSRRSARACSRRSRRWASRRSSPTTGRRSSRRSGSRPDVVERHFTGTASRIGGIGLDVLARETLARHLRAYPEAGELLPGRRRLRVARATASTTSGTRRRSRSSSTRSATAAAPSYDEWAAEMNESLGAARVAARADRAALRRGRRRAARRGRAGERDRQALRDRRDVARLALARGARDARDRDEPARRPLQHRRGRGGRGALRARPERRLAPLGDQAGRVRPLRRDGPLPHERRRDPDQDGAGREARRGRPAARPQGRRLHRQDPRLDAGRRADLAAAAPRHLLDRGPQAADLRPALRQPGGAHLGQARRPRSGSAPSPRAWRRRTPTTS